MSDYGFNVIRAEDIDFQRILKEAPALQQCVVVGNSAIRSNRRQFFVFLRTVFLEKFVPEDGIIVAGENLCAAWGWQRVNARYEIDKTVVFDNVSGNNHVSGWRGKVLHAPDLSCLKEELAAARKFTRRITIRVYYL